MFYNLLNPNTKHMFETMKWELVITWIFGCIFVVVIVKLVGVILMLEISLQGGR